MAPDRTFFAARDAGGAWREFSYGEMLQRVRQLAAALLEFGLCAERPLAILSGNDPEHLQLAMAAL